MFKVLALLLISLWSIGCDLDDALSNKSRGDDEEATAASQGEAGSGSDSGSGSDYSTPSSPPAGEPATLVIRNDAPYYIYPSLDDVSIGGTLVKLGHIDAGTSRAYTIASGYHWLVIYSAVSRMYYEAKEYITVWPNSQVTFSYDGSTLRAQ